jgi:hypothetical protein
MTNTDSPSPDDPVIVHLVGGPPDWQGELPCLRGDIEDVPFDELGGMYIVDGAHLPPQGPDEDQNPRAHYAPEEGGDRYVWHFQGWVPHSPADPPPCWYLPTADQHAEPGEVP